MKKWTYAMGLATAFALVACSGEDGVDGARGADGTSCVATALKDSSGFEITCGDEVVGVVKDGEKGLDGKDGKDGANGKDGENGVDGKNGKNGDKGKDGSSCVVKPMGSDGFKVLCDGDSVGVLVNGTNGAKGEPGAKGDSGVAGKSAYELAVEAGFEGDEVAWRAALKGDQGVKGDTGVAGKSAYDLAVEAGFKGDEAAWRAALKGDKGDDCSLKDNDDGSVTVSCGKDAGQVTLYKAMCGATPYDPSEKFCFGVDLYDYCDGEAYNADKQFCDTRDGGRLYKYVKIGSQTWMAENLNYATEVSGSDSNSFCYGDGDTYGEEITDRGAANCAKYGRLYNINSLQNVCPAGWRLPTKDDIEALLVAVGDDPLTAGKLLKSATDWSVKGSDAFGFSALPAGYRDENEHFMSLGSETVFWSSTPSMEDYTYTMSFGNHDTMGRGGTYSARGRAFSIRCIKN